jgi:hypothetical protein
MKQVLFKAAFLITVACFISAGVGVNTSNACDKKLCAKVCLRIKKQSSKIHIKKSQEAKDYPDLILTNNILRF